MQQAQTEFVLKTEGKRSFVYEVKRVPTQRFAGWSAAGFSRPRGCVSLA